MKYIKLKTNGSNCTGCAKMDIVPMIERMSYCCAEFGLERGTTFADFPCTVEGFVYLEDTPENRVRVATERLKP